MLLQKILYPDEKTCNTKELFYRGNFDLQADNSIRLYKGDSCSFDTYFNSFSVGKWLKYTVLQNLQFTFEVSGNVNSVKVEFFRSEGKVDNGKLKELQAKSTHKEEPAAYSDEISECLDCTTETHKVSQSVCGNKIVCEVDFADISEITVIYPVITAAEDVVIKNIQYETKIEESTLNPVNLAIGICTYKREEFVKRNIQQLLDNVINNNDSILHDHFEVYISDNGQTLPQGIFASEKIHLFQNINLGGSAGFTRTIIESLIKDKDKNFTHIILMDDDILLPVSTLERNYILLQLLKKEYQDSMIGGTMLTKEHMLIQRENGAAYVGSKEFELPGHYYNLKDFKIVVCNNVETAVNYNGWWYCCIPAQVVEENKLPLPFFIHYDDIEYGVRNSKKELIILNGLCVWHPDFTNKAPVWGNYYDCRNYLIMTCLYDFNITKRFIMASRDSYFNTVNIFDDLIFYPKNIPILVRALKDFCKGPEYFMNQNACELHKELVGYKVEWKKLDELNVDVNTLVKHPYKKYRISRLIQLILFFIPIKTGTKLIDWKNKEFPFFARNLVCYNPKTEKAYLVDMTKCKFFRRFIAFMYYKFLFSIKYNKLKKEWLNAKDRLTSLEFWKDYLQLN